MTDLQHLFERIFQNPQNIVLGALALIIILIIIILLTGGKKEKKKKGQLPYDVDLNEVVGTLTESSNHVHVYLEEQKEVVAQQERLVTEKQMQLQRLEEQVLQMKHELQLLDDAPQEVRDKFVEINERTALEVRQKVRANGNRMLLLGFFLAVASYILGNLFLIYRSETETWVKTLFSN